MSIAGPAGENARRAWRRLARHALTGRGAGDASLDALSDIGALRRFLEQAELASVRTARRHGKSWAEIATNLGVTRQSAWERWRDLDEPAAADEDIAESTVALVARDVVDAATRGSAKASVVEVPDVIAMTCDQARQALADVGLTAVRHRGGGKPRPLKATDEGVVVEQVPQAGARRRPGSTVTVWIERDGGSAGVREPRRPHPSPKTARAEADVPGDGIDATIESTR